MGILRVISLKGKFTPYLCTLSLSRQLANGEETLGLGQRHTNQPESIRLASLVT